MTGVDVLTRNWIYDRTGELTRVRLQICFPGKISRRVFCESDLSHHGVLSSRV
jgi:hypothetical protein